MVVAEGLGRHWAGVWAVRDVDLVVAPGEIFGLVGPDGAGKSTLLRLLSGGLTPHAGRAAVLGRAVEREGRRVARSVGYLSQGLGLYHDLTVMENLRFCAALYGVRDAAVRIRVLLEGMGLTGHEWKAAAALSGGMRQKLGLACALVHQPRLVFLDEPTTGVDPVARREFWTIVADLRRRGTAFVVTTPYMDEAEHCDRIAFLFAGRILAADTPAAFRRAFPHTVFAAGLPAGAALGAARALSGHLRVRVAGNNLRIYAAPGTATAAIAAACARVGYGHLGWRAVAPGLEDVFLGLLGGAVSGGSGGV